MTPMSEPRSAPQSVPQFVPLLDAPGDPEEPSLLIAVQGTRVVLLEGEPETTPSGTGGIFLGVLDGRHCWAVDAGPDGDGGARDDVTDLYRLWSSVDEPTWALAGRAVQLVEWQRNHQFCGRCGTSTVDAPGERARKCPECGLLAYPRLAPAVIMLVERDDGRALLARNANFPNGMFSCLAGFVEPGETLEHAVRREVMEEVGLEIGDVEFRGSQPWPFPHQVMIGFGAQYLSGDIAIDGQEIVEAQWFTPDETPSFPTGGMSIAGRLIDEWRTRVG
jgi:NAD+ diphosphatase